MTGISTTATKPTRLMIDTATVALPHTTLTHRIRNNSAGHRQLVVKLSKNKNKNWRPVLLQCESKKTPWGYLIFFHFFHKRLRIFNRFFTHPLHVLMYARLQIFMQLSPTLTKLCHIKRDNLVHIICAKCPKRVKTREFRRLRKSLTALLIVVCSKSL